MIVLATSEVMASSTLEMPPGQAPTPTLVPGGSQTDADVLVQEGNRLYSNNDFSNALKNYHSALDIYKALGDRAGVVYVLIQIGDIHFAKGQYRKALEFYQESWPEGEAHTLGSVGAIYIQLGDYQKAFQFTQAALSIKRAAKDRGGEATYLINIGVIYLKLGEYEEANEYFQKALLISQEIDDLSLKATALNNLGETCYHQGDYQKALDYLFQALSIRQNLDNPIKVASTLHSIGLVYESLGNYEEATEHYEQAISTSQKADYRLGEAQGLNDIGRLLGRLDQHQRAIEFLKLALTIAREQGISEGEATLLSNIGLNYYALGEYAKALENYQQALSIYRATGHRVGESYILANIGGIYNDLGNPQKAMEYHQQALLDSRIIGYTAGEVYSLVNIGLIHEEKGDYQKSFEYYSQSITTLEKVREKLTVEELRAAPVLGTSDIYERAIISLLKLNRPTDAFNYAERARARTFLDLLGNQRVNPKGSENLQLIEQERQLVAEITTLERQLHQEWIRSTLDNTSQEIENLTSVLETKRKEYRNLLFQLQLSNPEYAALVSISPLDLEKVQEMLREQAPDTTLVTYFVGAEETVSFVISSDSFHAQTVSVSRDDLRRQVENLREQMKEEPILPNAWQTPAQTLYDWLIRPVQSHLPSTEADAPSRLGIIPHDLLHYIPFGLLYDGENTLLDNYTLFYAPSVSSLKFIFEKRHPQADRLLVIAKPNVPQTPYLYHAVEEAQTVAALYGSQALVDSDATEGRFKTLAEEYELIHIAAHSDYIPSDPLFSAILLGEEESEDGRLETHEIFNLDLSMTDLVVLSACETHLGKLSSGDELVGLERAFIRAGTPSLLSTLWSVDDAATAELMKRFYTHLQTGLSKGEALRLAQLGTREEYPEPYYWAGFVLVGDYGESDGNLRKDKGQNQWSRWVVAGAVILVVGVIVLFWRRQRCDLF